MHMIKFIDIWEQKLFPLLIVRGWKYCRGDKNIVTIFSPRGEDIVGVKISSHTHICKTGLLPYDSYPLWGGMEGQNQVKQN